MQDIVAEPKDRRVKLVSLSLAVLGGMVTEGWVNSLRCDSGIPDDAEVVGAFIDNDRNTVELIVHHPDYPTVPAGATIPYVECWYTSFDFHPEDLPVAR